MNFLIMNFILEIRPYLFFEAIDKNMFYIRLGLCIRLWKNACLMHCLHRKEAKA